MTRDAALISHQTVIATELLTNEPGQIILIADGTYLYYQKSSNNKFQRRAYSNHKYRHLIKPIILTASVSMITNQGLKKGKTLMNANSHDYIQEEMRMLICL